ncbi:alpha/beta fold hydrolase [uncultured Psychroserpens sp.]|uniref:alpha/beta hydrolase n=1 Tax=uncultured Psychroserpens sp. TaxID=255436 RepID=UPI00262B0D8E|nr:alpha/beta fold hydrolase [uncultured Psychroserpens sp.]
MKKKIIYTLLIVLIILGIGSVLISKYVLPYAIIQPPKVSLDITPSDLKLNYSELDILTKDSIKLKGYWIKTDSIPPKSIVIFVHGIGGCKEHFLDLSKNLTEIGIESIIMDSRAHGKSEGQFCTYGYKEKEDISSIVNYIKNKNDSIPIGIWGNSMGGAIAIQALEHDSRIEFGIVESTFTTLNDIVYDYQKAKTYGIGLSFLCNIALNEAGELGQFKPDQVSPISSVKHIEQPMLIAHGDHDENIKFEYGKLLFENLKSTNKKFIAVKNGGHFDLSQKGGNSYKQAIKNFLVMNSKQLQKSSKSP